MSRATAARALGGYGYVQDSTREAVLRIANSIGYVPNSIARSMVTGRTRTIGFISADMENPFFARTMAGITAVARSAGYEVVIANSQEDPELERRAVRTLHDRQVDGMIVAPAQYADGSHLRLVVERAVPVVLLDRSVRGVPADAVLIDNVKAARMAVEHLIHLGHERIGLLTNDLGGSAMECLTETALDPTHASTGASRGVGYLAALRDRGLEVTGRLIRSTTYTRESARRATQDLLAMKDRPTAVLAVDNVSTLGAFEAIQASGLAFPEEISLLGFDDLEWTTIVRPTLSVIAQPAYDIGATAARRLIARLGGEDSPAQVLFLDTNLVQRESVVAPSDHRVGASSRRAER